MGHRKTILFVTIAYPSKEEPINGIFIQEQAKAVSLCNNVVVLSSGPSKIALSRRIYKVSENIDEGIRIVRVSYPRLSISDYVLRLLGLLVGLKYLFDQGFKPDVIHAHYFAAGLPALLLGRIRRIPVFISEHWSGFGRNLLKWHGIILARFVMTKADLVCPVSENLEKHIKKYGIKARFKVVPNTINTSIFFPYRNIVRETNNKKILFVGLLDPVKGIPYLLKAIRLLKVQRSDFILDIIGDGPNRHEYEELVDKLNLRDIVKFHGLKSKKEVAEFMRQCDFLVLPSIWENQPNVIIEAMACGKPVIATMVGGVPEIVRKENGILVPPRNYYALAEAINFMLDNYNKYDSDIIARHVHEKFGYVSAGHLIDSMYDEVLCQMMPKKR